MRARSSEMSGAERKAMELAQRTWLEANPFGMSEGFGPGWLAARDYYGPTVADLRMVKAEEERDRAENRERVLREALKKNHAAIEYARSQELSERHDWLDDQPILDALEDACAALRREASDA